MYRATATFALVNATSGVQRLTHSNISMATSISSLCMYNNFLEKAHMLCEKGVQSCFQYSFNVHSMCFIIMIVFIK